MYTLFILALYTVLVLLFVPLDKISKWQKNVRESFNKIVDKTEDK